MSDKARYHQVKPPNMRVIQSRFMDIIYKSNGLYICIGLFLLLRSVRLQRWLYLKKERLG